MLTYAKNIKDDMMVEKPIARSRSNRLKQGIVHNGRYAKSYFAKLLQLENGEELIACKLETGRTHQIRVHLESVNRHIIGDALYGFKSKKDNIDKIYLHAKVLYLKHPTSGEQMKFSAQLPQYFLDYLKKFTINTRDIDVVIDLENIVNRFDIFT